MHEVFLEVEVNPLLQCPRSFPVLGLRWGLLSKPNLCRLDKTSSRMKSGGIPVPMVPLGLDACGLLGPPTDQNDVQSHPESDLYP